MWVLGYGEQYALKQKRGFVGERFYIVHFGKVVTLRRDKYWFAWKNGIKSTGMLVRR
jgi:hypothetical protein